MNPTRRAFVGRCRAGAAAGTVVRFAAALLVGALPAQQEPTADPAPAPLLRCRSNDPKLLRVLAEAAGTTAATPIDSDHHGLLVLAADATAACTTVPAPGPGQPDTEIALHPGSWLRLYARQVDALRRELRPRIDAALESFGMPPGGGGALLDDAMQVLPMIEALSIEVRGSVFDATAKTTVAVRITPRAETPLANWLSVLAPHPRGVPMLPDAGGTAAISLRLSLAPTSLVAAAEPFARHVVGLNADITGGLPRARARFDALLAAIDGTVVLRVDERDIQLALGLQQPQRYAELLHDRDWLRDEATVLRERGIDAVHATEAVERGPRLLRTSVGPRKGEATAPRADAPTATGLVTFAAVRGDLALTTGGTDAGAARTAMQRLLDAAAAPLPRQALLRQAAPGPAEQDARVLLEAELDLGAWSAPDPPATAATDGRSRLCIGAARDGTGLRLWLELR